MPQLKDFIRTWNREFATTIRLFSVYPENRLNYRPHEVLKSAGDLMWTIACEEGSMVEGCLRGKIEFKRSPTPKTVKAIIEAYKKRHATLVKKVEKAGDTLFAKEVNFFVAKGKMGKVSVKDLLWDLLHDQIHHRGQLTIYHRLVGAKVTSIYGPTADEPW